MYLYLSTHIKNAWSRNVLWVCRKKGCAGCNGAWETNALWLVQWVAAGDRHLHTSTQVVQLAAGGMQFLVLAGVAVLQCLCEGVAV